MLLMVDPRPLVDRLGVDFFREAPQSPGVYLMRDANGTVVYVGKAKNLRNRLRSYRVANPDRIPRRHLRLLRAAVQIELQLCDDEAAALARESALLRALRPRFNRAGTWPGIPRLLLWRESREGLEVAVALAAELGWHSSGAMGIGAFVARAALVRLLWCALSPQCGFGSMPAGWFTTSRRAVVTVPRMGAGGKEVQEMYTQMAKLFGGEPNAFTTWMRDRTTSLVHRFEITLREADLSAVTLFFSRGLRGAMQLDQGSGS